MNNLSRLPSLRAFLLMRILLVTGFFAVALTGAAQLYLNYVFERQETQTFRTALDSAAKTVRSDLEIGDLWSVRRNLAQLVDPHAVSSMQLSNDVSGLVLSVPDNYDPAAATGGKAETVQGQYAVSWASPNAHVTWKLTGIPGRRIPSRAEHQTRRIYLAAICFLVAAFAFSTWFWANRLVADIDAIDQTLARISHAEAINSALPESTTLEARRALLRIQETSRILVDSIKSQQELAVRGAIGEVAQQVAHDIRSPLAALDSVLKDLSQLPEERRILIRSAVGRIRDIANNLIEKNRMATAGADAVRSIAPEPGAPQLLSSLVDSLVTEKRLQFRAQLGVEIDSRIDLFSYGLFASIPPSEFKRVVSNLINNAVEALPGKGLVTVRLAAAGDAIEIRIRDSGKGIPADLLSRLGQRGATQGKVGGSGLGLHHAKTNVEAWGGALLIDSEPGKGTTVTIRLLRAQAPAWFVSELVINPSARVVVLDDDTSIHQVWRGRFDSARVQDQGVAVLHFSTPQELRAWVHKETHKSGSIVYLMDYELLGHRETGLALAEELGVGKQTILVTSRFEEAGILAESSRLGTRLIPKPLAGFVPIVMRNAVNMESLDATLIDDDELIRMNWKMEAEKAGLKFRSFASIEEFLAASDGIDRGTPIYVDANLANGVNGAEESARLHVIGFHEIQLTTGHAPERFSHFKHLRGVIGKDPPWATTDPDAALS